MSRYHELKKFLEDTKISAFDIAILPSVEYAMEALELKEDQADEIMSRTSELYLKDESGTNIDNIAIVAAAEVTLNKYLNKWEAIEIASTHEVTYKTKEELFKLIKRRYKNVGHSSKGWISKF